MESTSWFSSPPCTIVTAYSENNISIHVGERKQYICKRAVQTSFDKQQLKPLKEGLIINMLFNMKLLYV